MIAKIVSGASAFFLLASAAPAPEAVPDQAARHILTRIASLAGEWEGTLEWTGARTGKGRLRANYYVIGNGVSVVENLIMGEGDSPSMTSVYHLDGSDLRMTHFCGANNQPRLRAGRIDEASGSASFDFVDVTNAGPKNPGYVQAAEIRIADADHVTIAFTFQGGGPRAVETIHLTRRRSA